MAVKTFSSVMPFSRNLFTSCLRKPLCWYVSAEGFICCKLINGCDRQDLYNSFLSGEQLRLLVKELTEDKASTTLFGNKKGTVVKHHLF